jgi:hypothetical protein
LILLVVPEDQQKNGAVHLADWQNQTAQKDHAVPTYIPFRETAADASAWDDSSSFAIHVR